MHGNTFEYRKLKTFKTFARMSGHRAEWPRNKIKTNPCFTKIQEIFGKCNLSSITNKDADDFIQTHELFMCTDTTCNKQDHDIYNCSYSMKKKKDPTISLPKLTEKRFKWK